MDLQEFLSTLFQIVIIPLLSVLTTYAVKWINAKAEEIKAKTENEYVDKYVSMLDKSITSAVIAVNQTYVDALKEEGKFDSEAQKIAFKKAYDLVLLTITDESAKYLKEAIGDLQLYITRQIEATIKNLKTEP